MHSCKMFLEQEQGCARLLAGSTKCKWYSSALQRRSLVIFLNFRLVCVFLVSLTIPFGSVLLLVRSVNLNKYKTENDLLGQQNIF